MGFRQFAWITNREAFLSAEPHALIGWFTAYRLPTGITSFRLASFASISMPLSTIIFSRPTQRALISGLFQGLLFEVPVHPACQAELIPYTRAAFRFSRSVFLEHAVAGCLSSCCEKQLCRRNAALVMDLLDATLLSP